MAHNKNNKPQTEPQNEKVFVQRLNTGVMFENQKETETHPDWKGNFNIDGVKYYISAWDKTSKDGETEYMSLSIQKAD